MKLMKVVAALVYVFLLCYVVFFARRRESMKDYRRRELINVVPVVHQVKTYYDLLDQKDKRGERHFFINLVGNILLFLPLPVLLYVFGIRSKKNLLVIALVTTSGIEAIQLFFHIGVPDIDDVLLNMTGAFAGILILYYLPRSVRTSLARC